jgi:hypothetical protein
LCKNEQQAKKKHEGTNFCIYLIAYTQQSNEFSLNIEAVCSSETFVSTYKFIRRYNPADQQRHLHRRENVESHNRLGSVAYFFERPNATVISVEHPAASQAVDACWTPAASQAVDACWTPRRKSSGWRVLNTPPQVKRLTRVEHPAASQAVDACWHPAASQAVDACWTPRRKSSGWRVLNTPPQVKRLTRVEHPAASQAVDAFLNKRVPCSVSQQLRWTKRQWLRQTLSNTAPCSFTPYTRVCDNAIRQHGGSQACRNWPTFHRCLLPPSSGRPDDGVIIKLYPRTRMMHSTFSKSTAEFTCHQSICIHLDDWTVNWEKSYPRILHKV